MPTPELYYPAYVWIVFGWYEEGWWLQDIANDNNTLNCTDEVLEDFLKRTLIIGRLPRADDESAATDVNLVGC